MQLERSREEAVVSIRSLALVATVTFGILTLLVIVALIWGSSQLQQSTTMAIRDSKSQAIVNELQLSLLTYQRLSNLYVLTGEVGLAETRAAIRREVEVLLTRAQDYVGSPMEQELADLFTPFSRRRSDIAPGAGLGLSVVHRIVAVTSAASK